MSDNKDLIRQSLSKPAKTFFADVGELSLDQLIKAISTNTELLQSLPVIKWLFLGNDVRTIIQSSFFIKKYAAFINPFMGEFAGPQADSEAIDNLLASKNGLDQVVEQTLITIDRYQTTQKAEILGLLFIQTFKYQRFTADEYKSLLFSIELLHPVNGIPCLVNYYSYKKQYESADNDEAKNKIWADGCRLDYSGLANTGLLRLPIGGAYVGDLGGAYITDMGVKLVDHVIRQLGTV
jgi:hypothetical protein